MKLDSMSRWIPWVYFLPVYLLLAQSCKPDDPDPLVVIQTGDIEEVGATHCIIHGEILEIGLDGIGQHGFVWSESSGVDLENGEVNQLGPAFAPGTFFSKLKNLDANTTYHVRAYASSGSKTIYGEEKTLTTTDPTVPELHTLGAFEVESYTAGSGGDIVSNGGAPISRKGVCWSTGRFPTIDDPCTRDGEGSGSFETTLGPLEPFTVYHMRAYATNRIGTGYGEELIFFTLWDNAPVVDFDGNTYATVQIGDQVWMAENLKSEHYSDGSSLQKVELDADWMALETDVKAYCYFDNSTDMYDTFGALYSWAAAMNGEAGGNGNPGMVQGVCPTGWHLPSEEEWLELEYHLGMSELIAEDIGWRGYEEGGMLKQTGTALWLEPNLMATNETGFTALPAGFRDVDGLFRANGSFTSFWSSTGHEEGAWLRGLHAGRGEILHEPYEQKNGFSVRCVKDR